MTVNAISYHCIRWYSCDCHCSAEDASSISIAASQATREQEEQQGNSQWQVDNPSCNAACLLAQWRDDAGATPNGNRQKFWRLVHAVGIWSSVGHHFSSLLLFLANLFTKYCLQ